MPNMTLKELIDRINSVPKHYGINPEEEVVVDAWIAGPNDKTFPPGSILFECVERNVKNAMPEDIHTLSIFPPRITNLQ